MDYNDRPLHDLLYSDNNVETLRKVLARGKDPNSTDSIGDTLLHVASKSIHDNPGIVQELINAGADVSRVERTLSTALHFAVIRGKRKVVDVLLQTEIPVNQKNYLGITALHYAINRNVSRILNITGVGTDIYIVRKLLNHRLINVNEMDSYQQTPLLWAIKNIHFEIVKLLLDKNADMDIADAFMKTPLHHALVYRNRRIVLALLLKRASILAMAGDGITPLDNIINSQCDVLACTCLKVIAFNYNLKEILINKLMQFPERLQFLSKCWNEMDCMKNDFIENELSVFAFFSKCDAKSGYENPILQIYKPVVGKLLAGKYPEYLGYILNRMSKSILHAVLEVYINESYENKSCEMEYFTEFWKIIQIRLLRKYLSNEEIFCLIVTFTEETVDRHLLGFHEHEWDLTDLWDVYPNDHFS